MDGVSAASAIFGIVLFAGQVALRIQKYGHDIKHAEDDCKKLTSELEQLSLTLASLAAHNILDDSGRLINLQKNDGSHSVKIQRRLESDHQKI